MGLRAGRGSGALLAVSLAACSACGKGAEHKEPAPPAETSRPGGPGYFDPSRVAPPPPGASDGPPAASSLAPWVVTDDADEWVRKSFVLQASHARAFVVGAGPALAEVEVPAPGVGSRGGVKGKTQVRVKVAGTFATIGEAIGAAKGGDVVAVRPGRYPGFVIADDSSMRDGAYLSIVALGKPGEVIVDRAAPADPSWMILVRGGHHVVIDGLAILGTRDGKGPRGGIMIDGDFRNTGKLAHHVVVRNVWSDGHRKWGIHATDTRSVLVEDSFFTRSFEEHGVYVSDGSDDWTIRRNVFFSNNAGGLQINVDPLASFEETVEHPRFAGHPRHEGTRAWAELTLKRGDELFGANAWPDGRGYNFHVTQNVMNENGRIGGAAINLAGVSDSLFENNLVYGNQAGGIALWDNQNPYDEQAVAAPPLTAADAVPAKLPLFGCRNDRIRNNTVVLDGRRASIQCRNGSTGCAIWNNLAINAGSGPGIEIFGTSMLGLDAWNNVIGRVDYSESTPALFAVVQMAPEKGGRTNVDAKTALAELEDPSKAPWLRVDGPWPEVWPQAPSYRPKAASTLMRVADPKRQPPTDLDGKARGATTTIGALLPR